MAKKKPTGNQRGSQRPENKRRKHKSPAGFPSLKAEERRLLAIARRRAKQRIEKAVDKIMDQYLKFALGPNGAEVVMHYVDRLIPAAPQMVIIVKKTSAKNSP